VTDFDRVRASEVNRKKGSACFIAALRTIHHSPQMMILVVTKSKTPILQQKICDEPN